MRSTRRPSALSPTGSSPRRPAPSSLPDTPAVRLVIHAWQAMVEDLVLTWCAHPAGLTREDLVVVITSALPAIIDTLP
ncbi:hypothetical protein [Nocardioides convexus]|uniref:hypothetical protein n=1 Tax=Nocardioides convexus TaxID=2712224 RepID=UPI0024187296|nr:hypothetical protein [Nocardioides convexus]